MPVKSKKQFGLMQAAKAGKVPGISPETASEFLGHQSPKGLPETAKKQKWTKKGKMPAAVREDGSKRKGW